MESFRCAQIVLLCTVHLSFAQQEQNVQKSALAERIAGEQADFKSLLAATKVQCIWTGFYCADRSMKHTAVSKSTTFSTAFLAPKKCHFLYNNNFLYCLYEITI